MRCTSRSLIATQPNVRLQLAVEGGGHFYFAQGGHSNFARTQVDVIRVIMSSRNKHFRSQTRHSRSRSRRRVDYTSHKPVFGGSQSPREPQFYLVRPATIGVLAEAGSPSGCAAIVAGRADGQSHRHPGSRAGRNGPCPLRRLWPRARSPVRDAERAQRIGGMAGACCALSNRPPACPPWEERLQTTCMRIVFCSTS